MCPLALKEETRIGEQHDDPLVILTKRGIAYLDIKCNKKVNKNGKRIHGVGNVSEIPERRPDAQRLDNKIFNLVLPFYKAPSR